MNQARTSGPSGGRSVRLALAALSGLLLAGSLAVVITTGHSRARARVTTGGNDGGGVQSIGGLAAQVQANIAGQRQLQSEHSTQVDRHALKRPDDQPPRSQAGTLTRAETVVRRWLAGYLPYEVDQAGPIQQRYLTATSTPRLARSLLAHPPLIPPAQQHQRPPEGRLLGLEAKVAAGGRIVGVYVEVAYGLEQEGFHLTLTRGTRGWLVAAFHG